MHKADIKKTLSMKVGKTLVLKVLIFPLKDSIDFQLIEMQFIDLLEE